MISGTPKILTVTVIYNQRIEDTNVYRTLLSGCNHVFIYDNSPSAKSADNLQSGWIYVADTSNPGLSTAYNKAAKYARDHGYEWLLICDQDTIFPKNAIQTYIKNIKEHPDENMFIPRMMVSDNRYMSPVKSRNYIAGISADRAEGRIELKKYAVINSGMMVNTEAFLKCGGYNEDVFLDFSDFQFVERFADLYPSAFVMDMTCKQNFSNLTDSTESKLQRFRLFCKSLSGYESCYKFGKQKISLIVTKRALSLCLKSKSFKPLSILLKTYF